MTFNRLLLLAILLAASTSAQAQRFNQKSHYDDLRRGTWEASLLASYGNTTSFAGESGSFIDVDSAVGWGFTVGYNLSSRWNVSYKFTLHKPDYLLVRVTDPEEGEDPVIREINHTLDRYAHALNVTWHWFDGPLTPYLQGGIGYTKLDSNIPSQPPQTGCWWDPWWGYICDTQWKTFSTSEMTYNLGLGVRWDINGAFFVRGVYSREWFGSDNYDLDYDTLSVDFGLMW
jgi:opacity protein-like surface antigen